MEELLAGADTEALVDIVKLAQKQGMKGEKGAWKEFLASHDTKRGASDPRRRSLDVLVSFLKSFTKKEDIKFFRKALKCYRNSKSLEQLTESVPVDGSPDQATEDELSKLLLHGVPKFVPSEELKYIFPKDSTVEIQPVSKVNGQKYSTLAVFRDSVEAEDVFERLKGKQEKDTCGRPQKLVSVELSNEVSAFLYVRKMRTEAFTVPTSCKRSSDTEEGTRKKLKGDDSDQCIDHIKEIERLKHELRQREDEILNLQKIIAAVTRKHGL